MTSFLVPRLKPNNAFDVVEYKEMYLDPNSFLEEIKHKFPNVIITNELKKVTPPLTKPRIIVPPDEYVTFLKRFRKHIRIPNRWRLSFHQIIMKHFGQAMFDLLVKLNLKFVVMPRQKRTIPQKPIDTGWVCPGWNRNPSPPRYPYPTRDDIPRLMLEIRKEKQIREILNVFMIDDLSSICLQFYGL